MKRLTREISQEADEFCGWQDFVGGPGTACLPEKPLIQKYLSDRTNSLGKRETLHSGS